MGNDESEAAAEAWIAAAALGLGNGGAKDADLERKGEAAAADVGGRKRRPEQLGCGGLRPSKEVAAPVGMVDWGLAGFWGQACLPVTVK